MRAENDTFIDGAEEKEVVENQKRGGLSGNRITASSMIELKTVNDLCAFYGQFIAHFFFEFRFNEVNPFNDVISEEKWSIR